MPDLVITVIGSIFRALCSRRYLVLENLALRHQLAVLNRTAKHKRLSSTDRLFWAVLSRWWHCWTDALVIVRPDTVIRWHRAAFKALWTRKSMKRKPGRPAVPAEVRALIRKMNQENPLWGAPRIPRRTGEARHRDRSSNCVQVHAAHSKTAIANLAHVLEEPCSRNLGH